MKSMSQCVTEFREAAEFQNLSRSAQKRQMIVLNRLLKIVGPSTPISRLDQSHVDKTINQSRGKVVEASLNAYRTDLRRFGKWIVDRRHHKFDPAAHLENKTTHTPPAKRKPIKKDQATALIAYAASVHPRDGITAKLLLMLGSRESEVVHLKWQDVDFESGLARFHRPKRDDWHTIPMMPALREALVEWKTYVEARFGPVEPTWYVAPALATRMDKTGQHRMNPDWPIVPTRKQTNIAKRVKTWLRYVGEIDLFGRASHTLRRTTGNLMIDSGKFDIRDVQMLYGHGSQAMTEIYLDKNQARDRLARGMEGFSF